MHPRSVKEDLSKQFTFGEDVLISRHISRLAVSPFVDML